MIQEEVEQLSGSLSALAGRVELDPEELEGIQTVGDVMEFIKKYTDQ